MRIILYIPMQSCKHVDMHALHSRHNDDPLFDRLRDLVLYELRTDHCILYKKKTSIKIFVEMAVEYGSLYL